MSQFTPLHRLLRLRSSTCACADILEAHDEVDTLLAALRDKYGDEPTFTYVPTRRIMNRQTSAAVGNSSLCYDCCCGCVDEGESVNKGSGAVVIESGGYSVALADNKRKLYCAALSEVPSPVDNANGSCSLRCEG